jgi:hypothetical protein
VTDAAPPDARPRPRGWRYARDLFVLLAVVAGMLCAICGIGLSFLPGDFSVRGEPIRGGATGSGAQEIELRLQSVNTTTGDAELRLRLVPTGSLASEFGSVTRSVRLLSPGTSRPVIDIPAGQPPPPYEVTVDLAGTPAIYPFDTHVGVLYLELQAVEADGRTTPLPLSIAFDDALAGTRTALDVEVQGTRLAIEMTFTRPGTTVYFVGMVAALMWALSLAALVTSALLALGRRKIEPTLFNSLAAMVFAFPALRATLPGAPPVGAFFDYLVFFWAEAIVGTALLTGVLAWIFRPDK